MNLFFIINNIICFTMNTKSSVFLCAGAQLDNIFEKIIGFAGQFLYSVAKWMLYFVDVCFFYIKQLAGLNTDTRSIESIFSKDADMVFNILFSNEELFTRIIKQLIGFAVVILIVLSIFSIIKGQFDALKTGKNKSPLEVVTSSFKSILIMLITPLMAILGIGASNILLKSLYSATDLTGSASLGTQIFAAASNSANKYRQYAMAGKRIPILYDFTEEDARIKLYVDQDKGELLQEYLKNSRNSIYTTYKMFTNEEFNRFDYVEDNALNYYKVYDRDPSVSSEASGIDAYRKIRAYCVEYYVMADVIDYAVTSSAFLHIMTIEELLDSICNLPNDINKQSIFDDIVSIYGIELYRNDTKVGNPPTQSLYNYFLSKNSWNVIRFTNDYYEPDEGGGDPIYHKQIQYNHVKGATDEALGAVFIVAGEKIEELDTDSDGIMDSSVPYNYPLTRNYSEYGAKKFESDYVEKNKMIVAKGIFNDSGHPTAIKKSNSGKEVVFYRNGLESVVLGEAGKILNSDFTPDEGEKEEKGGVFSKITSFFKDLFNPLKWLPTLKLSEDEVMTSYVKVSVTSGKLNNGELHIGYMFTDGLTSAISGNTYGLALYTLFNSMNLNYIVLLFGASLILKICFLSVFALIKRAYDLVLIIMVYPVTCSTMPLDNGNAYSQWFSSYLGKMLSTYGLILGINFVLLLFPIINEIQIFKPEDIAENKAVARFSSIFSAVGVSFNAQAKIVNFILCVLFELVAFSFLESGEEGQPGIYSIIMQLVNPNNADELYSGNPAGQMLKAAQDTAHMVTTVVATPLSLLTAQGREQLAKKIVEKVPIPGSAILNRVKQKKAAEQAMDRLNDLKSGKMSDEDKKKYGWNDKKPESEGEKPKEDETSEGETPPDPADTTPDSPA